MELRVDLVVICLGDRQLRLLAMLDEHAWQLPGRTVGLDEDLDAAVLRVVGETTGLRSIYHEQLYTFGNRKRDPRRRSVSCAYLVLAPFGAIIRPRPEWEHALQWFEVDRLPGLALDHSEIVAYALRRLRYKLEYSAVGFQLLPREFTLSELQRAYESILGERLDKRNFRKRILVANVIEPTNRTRIGEGRPAKLYRYRPDAVAEVRARRLFP
jgi:8-oxo-dGTP diphosphatase